MILLRRQSSPVLTGLLLCACVIVAVLASPAAAEIVTWTDASPLDNNWSNPDNWEFGLLPESLDTVIFPPVPGISVMDMPGLTLEELDLSVFIGELQLGHSLAVDVRAQLGGLVMISDRTLSCTGECTIIGHLDGFGGQLQVDGPLMVNPGAAIFLLEGVLELGGDATFMDPGSLDLTEGTLLIDGAGPQIINLPDGFMPLGDLNIMKPSPTSPVEIIKLDPFDLTGNLRVDGDLTINMPLYVGGNADLEPECVARHIGPVPGLLHVGGDLTLAGEIDCSFEDLTVVGRLLGDYRAELCLGNNGFINLGDSADLVELGSVDLGGVRLFGPGDRFCDIPGDLLVGGRFLCEVDPPAVVELRCTPSDTIFGGIVDVKNGNLLLEANLVVADSLIVEGNLDMNGNFLEAGNLLVDGGDINLGNGITVVGPTTVDNDGYIWCPGGQCPVRFDGPVLITDGELASDPGNEDGLTMEWGVEVESDGTFSSGWIYDYGNKSIPQRTTISHVDGPGSGPWNFIVHPGAQIDLNDIIIMDCDASGGEPVIAQGFSEDGGGNINVLFPGPQNNIFTGEAAGDQWSLQENWAFEDFAPDRGVFFATEGPLSVMDVPDLTLSQLDMTGFTGELRLEDELQVVGPVVQHGVLNMNGFPLVAGGLQVHGDLNLGGGDLTFSGESTIHDSGRLNGGDIAVWIWDFGPLEVRGTFDLPSAAGSGMSVFDRITITPSGTLRLPWEKGSGRIRLESDGEAGGFQWELDAQPGSTIDISNVKVQDSDASPGQPVEPGPNSVSAGNNDNWLFASPVDDEIPRVFSASVYPNPANPAVTVYYNLPQACSVKLVVYDLQGHLVRTLIDSEVAAGRRSATWRGLDDSGVPVASGVYFYMLQVADENRRGKITLVN